MTVSAADVSAAARLTLQTYLPAVLARGLNGRPALPAPTSYAEVPTTEAIRRVKRSLLAVSVPRTLGAPERFGDGTYDATFLLSVAVWHEQASDLPLLTAAGDYAAAVRATVLQHQSLGGLASQVVWTDESVDLVGDERSTLTLGLGICEFAVHVPQVADEQPAAAAGTEFQSIESTVFVNPKP